MSRDRRKSDTTSQSLVKIVICSAHNCHHDDDKGGGCYPSQALEALSGAGAMRSRDVLLYLQSLRLQRDAQDVFPSVRRVP